MARDFVVRPRATGPDVDALDGKTLKEAAEVAAKRAGRLIGQKTREWCTARGIAPSQRVEQAAELLMMIPAMHKNHLTYADLYAKTRSFEINDADTAEDFKLATAQVRQCTEELGEKRMAELLRSE